MIDLETITFCMAAFLMSLQVVNFLKERRRKKDIETKLAIFVAQNPEYEDLIQHIININYYFTR